MGLWSTLLRCPQVHRWNLPSGVRQSKRPRRSAAEIAVAPVLRRPGLHIRRRDGAQIWRRLPACCAACWGAGIGIPVRVGRLYQPYVAPRQSAETLLLQTTIRWNTICSLRLPILIQIVAHSHPDCRATPGRMAWACGSPWSSAGLLPGSSPQVQDSVEWGVVPAGTPAPLPRQSRVATFSSAPLSAT